MFKSSAELSSMSLLVPAFFDGVLGLFILIQNKAKTESNIIFAFFCWCIGLWTFGISMFGLVSITDAYFWNKEFIFAAGIVASKIILMRSCSIPVEVNIWSINRIKPYIIPTAK